MKNNFLYSLLIIMFAIGSNVASEDRHSTDMQNIYDLPITWQDHNADEFKLSSLSTKLTIFTLAYTRCKTAFPLTMQRMKSIERKLNKNKIDANYVVLSLDSERDTAVELKKYFEQYKLTSNSWHLLRGDSRDVRRLSVIFDYRYKSNQAEKATADQSQEEIIHSNKIFALNRNGEVIGVLDGLSTPIDDFVKELIQTINATPSH